MSDQTTPNSEEKITTQSVDSGKKMMDTQTSGQASTSSAPVLKKVSLESKEQLMKQTSRVTLIVSVVAVLAGIATGFGGYKLKAKSDVTSGSGGKTPMQQVAGETVHVGDVFGVQDAKTFKDSAEGYLDEGGLDGEGSHKLLRPGGDSQTVYLTSSITDLDKFVGMEVKIHGETFKGQTAGWLMDVGRVEILATEATPPSEE